MNIWKAMNRRCDNPSHISYSYYGGRGIKVCPAWAASVIVFEQWAIANGYADHLSIDRIDNDGNYCPDNCRWVDAKSQAINRRPRLRS